MSESSGTVIVTPAATIAEGATAAGSGTFQAAPIPSTAVPSISEEVKPAVQENIKEKLQNDDKFALKFAALGREEKRIKALKAQFEQQQAKMTADRDAWEASKSTKYVDIERFKREPLKVMEETGMSFQALTELVLNDGKPSNEQLLTDAEKRMEAKLAELQAKLDAKEAAEKAKQDEAALANEEKLVEEFIAGITDFVNVEPEYELIRANDAVALVYDVIEQHFERTKDANGNGQILSNKEAADAVEAYLLDEAKKHVSLSKVQKLLQPASTATQPAKTAATTLSNAHSSSAATPVKKFMSDEESKRQAARLIRWED